MMTDSKLKIIFGFLSFGLFIKLVITLLKIPGGMILPGWFLGGMLLGGGLLVSFIITVLLKLFIRKRSFTALLLLNLTILFAFFHYYFYSPTLEIVVQDGYYGEISLIKSNTERNILTVDNEGIGYLTKWTFNKTYARPTVFDKSGRNLDKNLVGFNPSTFFGTGKTCCVGGKQFESMSFEIVPDSLIGKKRYYSKNLISLVDKSLVLFEERDNYTTIPVDTVMTEIK
jgi:hypothetical protein